MAGVIVKSSGQAARRHLLRQSHPITVSKFLSSLDRCRPLLTNATPITGRYGKNMPKHHTPERLQEAYHIMSTVEPCCGFARQL